MTTDDRYDVSDLPEAQFESGSSNQVLRNRLGITSKQQMDEIEAKALGKTLDVLMQQFEQDVLGRWTPCRFSTRPEIVQALSDTHVELVLIHPFRDGNGRLARLVSTLMALQAGLPLLTFSPLAGEKKQTYFSAIRAGMNKDYAPMRQIFEEIIAQSLLAS